MSGHIHESPDGGRAWSGVPQHTATCGRTTCHQPGQMLPYGLSISIIEIVETSEHGGTPKVSIVWSQERIPD